MNAGQRSLELLAHLDHVVALRHDNADHHAFFSVMADLGDGRVFDAARHGGDIAEPDGLIACPDPQVANVVDGQKQALDIEPDGPVICLDRAGGRLRVLPRERSLDILRGDVALGQNTRRDLDMDFLILDAEHIHLADTRHAQENIARISREISAARDR